MDARLIVGDTVTLALRSSLFSHRALENGLAVWLIVRYLVNGNSN